MERSHVKFMIVDDNASMRSMIRSALVTAEDEFVECDGGAAAVSEFERLRPDCVLMDIQMKEVDGLTATRMIRQYDPSARIIIVSNFDSPAFRSAALRAGAEAYITKDDLSKLQQVVRPGMAGPV